jgi:hypothetical protein
MLKVWMQKGCDPSAVLGNRPGTSIVRPAVLRPFRVHSIVTLYNLSNPLFRTGLLLGSCSLLPVTLYYCFCMTPIRR